MHHSAQRKKRRFAKEKERQRKQSSRWEVKRRHRLYIFLDCVPKIFSNETSRFWFHVCSTLLSFFFALMQHLCKLCVHFASKSLFNSEIIFRVATAANWLLSISVGFSNQNTAIIIINHLILRWVITVSFSAPSNFFLRELSIRQTFWLKFQFVICFVRRVVNNEYFIFLKFMNACLLFIRCCSNAICRDCLHGANSTELFMRNCIHCPMYSFINKQCWLPFSWFLFFNKYWHLKPTRKRKIDVRQADCPDLLIRISWNDEGSCKQSRNWQWGMLWLWLSHKCDKYHFFGRLLLTFSVIDWTESAKSVKNEQPASPVMVIIYIFNRIKRQ